MRASPAGCRAGGSKVFKLRLHIRQEARPRQPHEQFAAPGPAVPDDAQHGYFVDRREVRLDFAVSAQGEEQVLVVPSQGGIGNG